MSAIAQQFTSDDTLIPIPNDIHTPTTKNYRASISASSSDECFQKLELKIYELNRSVNSELALLNKKNGFFFRNISINLLIVAYQANMKKSLEENISLLKKNLCMKDEAIKKLVETKIQFLTLYQQNLTINIQTF